MASRPLAEHVKPISNLLGWLMLIGAIALILDGSDVLEISRGWFSGYGAAFILVFLEAIRLQAIANREEDRRV